MQSESMLPKAKAWLPCFALWASRWLSSFKMIFVSVFLSLLHPHIAFISLNIRRFNPFALHVFLSFRVRIRIISM